MTLTQEILEQVYADIFLDGINYGDTIYNDYQYIVTWQNNKKYKIIIMEEK